MEDWRILITSAAVKGASSALAKTYIEEKISPFLRGIVSKKTEGELRKTLSRYTRHLESKTRNLPSIIKNSSPLVLDEIYEPITVSSKSTDSSYKIESYPREIFELARCISITDDAGMGKSTVVKFIARSALRESESIPLLIELRRLRPGISILGALCKELVNATPDSEKGKDLINALSNGGFIFILDGFDEIDEPIKQELVIEINEISSQFQFCQFILTTRPDYAESLFPEYHKFRINKLTEEQAHSIIKRIDSGRGLARTLISKISQTKVQEFLGTPLLVSLLYGAFDRRNTIPPKRTAFFKQVYDALFEDHDLSKGDAYLRAKECALDKEDFHKLVRSIGFESFKVRRESYTESELIELIEKSLIRSEISADKKKVLKDLTKSVPILSRDGMEYKWHHKSFQEYFTAQYITSDMRTKKADILKRMFHSKEALKYRELFKLVSEVDTAILHETCTIPFLKSIETIDPKTPIETLCLHDAVDIFYISSPEIGKGTTDFRNLTKEAFSVDVSDRPFTWVANRRSNCAIVSALKENGPRHVLLSAIDSKSFPSFSGHEARRQNTKHWFQTYGTNSFHVNESLQSLIASIESLGDIQYISDAACLVPAKGDALKHLMAQSEIRSRTEEATALDDF